MVASMKQMKMKMTNIKEVFETLALEAIALYDYRVNQGLGYADMASTQLRLLDGAMLATVKVQNVREA